MQDVILALPVPAGAIKCRWLPLNLTAPVTVNVRCGRISGHRPWRYAGFPGGPGFPGMVNRSSRVCVGCWFAPSPALITGTFYRRTLIPARCTFLRVAHHDGIRVLADHAHGVRRGFAFCPARCCCCLKSRQQKPQALNGGFKREPRAG